MNATNGEVASLDFPFCSSPSHPPRASFSFSSMFWSFPQHAIFDERRSGHHGGGASCVPTFSTSGVTAGGGCRCCRWTQPEARTGAISTCLEQLSTTR